MLPSFIQVTLVAGEFVEVQARVRFVVELVRWRLVTRGAAVIMMINIRNSYSTGARDLWQ